MSNPYGNWHNPLSFCTLLSNHSTWTPVSRSLRCSYSPSHAIPKYASDESPEGFTLDPRLLIIAATFCPLLSYSLSRFWLCTPALKALTNRLFFRGLRTLIWFPNGSWSHGSAPFVCLLNELRKFTLILACLGWSFRLLTEDCLSGQPSNLFSPFAE